MLTGATLPFAAVAPAAADLPAFAASAVPGPAAQLCIIRSFSLAEASAVAPLGYAGIVPATLWGSAVPRRMAGCGHLLRGGCDRGGRTLCLAPRNGGGAGEAVSEAAQDGAGGLRDRATGLFLRGLIDGLLMLPYRLRVPLCGWTMAWVVAPLAGWRARVRDNLALVLPDLPRAEVRRLMREVPRNMGKTLIEIYSGAEFVARAAAEPLQGEGVAALDAAHAAGRPVILVTGHFGNYDASRAALIARGFRVGALYRPLRDPRLNAHYVRAIGRIGTPVFSRGRQGMGEMIRFLRGGGMLGMLIDQHMGHGAPLTFLGHRAMTALSAAELALKYDALVVPVYGVRRADGFTFDIHVEPPVPHGDPAAMTQALNDSLERLVRRHPEQWFWVHRRWKAAASAPPG